MIDFNNDLGAAYGISTDCMTMGRENDFSDLGTTLAGIVGCSGDEAGPWSDFEEVQYNSFMYLMCDSHMMSKAECRQFFSGQDEVSTGH